jgi:hypothetical protein
VSREKGEELEKEEKKEKEGRMMTMCAVAVRIL